MKTVDMPSHSSLSENERADVCIVGAGIALNAVLGEVERRVLEDGDEVGETNSLTSPRDSGASRQ